MGAELPSRRQAEAYWKKEAEQAALDHAQEQEKQRGVRRRTLLRVAAGTGLGVIGGVTKLTELFIAADKMSRKDNLDDSPTRLEVLNECREWYPPRDGEQKREEAVITVGGLGCVNSHSHAYFMGIEGFGLPQETTTPMSFLVSKLMGKTIPEVAELIQKEAENAEGLSFYGQSNGSVVILEALHYLKKEKNITVPVKRFILNCSPHDFDDANEGFLNKLIGQLIVKTGYDPGSISQFLFKILQDKSIDRDHSLEAIFHAIEKAWNDTREGEPPNPWTADLRILVRSRLSEHDFTGILTPDTQMLFLSSRDDHVVRNNNSSRKFRDLAERHGAQFTEQFLPDGSGHASSEEGGKTARHWIEETGAFYNRRGAI